MFDLIGDIHGHADELKLLLCKLGYKDVDGVYKHPERKVIFVGDFIDRGPKIPEVLSIVKAMVDNDAAIAVMGNHEYNAICFHYERAIGGHYRSHSIKHILQHCETLSQFKSKQDEYNEYIQWFLTLPLFYENEDFRVVHACWDENEIEFLQSKLTNNCLTEDLLAESVDKKSELYNAIEVVLKGKELSLPNGETFKDADGFERREIRIKWWINPKGRTYKDLSIQLENNIPDINVDSMPNGNTYYGTNEKPVFFGHYWLRGTPEPIFNNVACLDYSVAKGGDLVAYRYDKGVLLKRNYRY
jgi:hypothetical protein